MTTYERIKARCKEQGISLAELGRRVGYAPRSILYLARKEPQVRTLRKFAAVLECDYRELMGD